MLSCWPTSVLEWSYVWQEQRGEYVLDYWEKFRKFSKESRQILKSRMSSRLMPMSIIGASLWSQWHSARYNCCCQTVTAALFWWNLGFSGTPDSRDYPDRYKKQKTSNERQFYEGKVFVDEWEVENSQTGSCLKKKKGYAYLRNHSLKPWWAEKHVKLYTTSNITA